MASATAPIVPSSKPPYKLRARDHLVSGALSGFASSIFLQPLDLIKTRMQQGPPPQSVTAVALEEVIPAFKIGRAGERLERFGKAVHFETRSREILPVVREVLQTEGVTGLWRGTVPTIARNVPGVAAYFYLLTGVRSRLAQSGFLSTRHNLAAPFTTASSTVPIPVDHTSSARLAEQAGARTTSPSAPLIRPPILGEGTDSQPQSKSKSTTLPKLSLTGNLIAGAFARTSVGFVLNPFTVLKSRYESNLYPTYTSLPNALASLLKTDGIRGLFQGFTATAIRDAPYAGISVVVYEECKELLGTFINGHGLGKDGVTKVWGLDWGVPYSFIHGASGSVAAAVATLATSPADCVKTKMQVMPLANPTMKAAIGAIYADRGLKGFFSGSSLRITRKAASAAIAWSTYEGMLLFIRDRAL